MGKTIIALQSERSTLETVAIRLSSVLKNNATDDENDAMIEYMDHLIKDATHTKSDQLNKLRDMKTLYEAKLEFMKKDTSSQASLNMEQVDQLCDQLTALEHSGNEMLNVLNQISRSYGGKIRVKKP